jgi:hypothetical protein
MFLFLRAGKKVKEEISPTLLPEGQSSNFRTGKHQWVADFLENYPPFQAPFVSPLGGICCSLSFIHLLLLDDISHFLAPAMKNTIKRLCNRQLLAATISSCIMGISMRTMLKQNGFDDDVVLFQHPLYHHHCW